MDWDGGARVGFVVALTRAVRRGWNFGFALDRRELISVMSIVGGGGCCSVGSYGRTATAGRFRGGTACHSGYGLTMATGNDIEGVGRELEEGLLALADLEGLGWRHHGVTNASSFSGYMRKSCVSVNERAHQKR